MRPQTRIMYALSDRITGRGARSAAEGYCLIGRAAPPGYQGAEPLGWLVEAHMGFRYLASSTTVAIVAAAICLGFDAAAGERPAPGGGRTRASAATQFRTPWGDPDLQGAWTNTTTTPLERPDAFAGKTVLTDEERRDLDERAVRNADRAPKAGDTGAYNDFWLDRGKQSGQTSLIVDPPDGKLPPLTPLGARLHKEIAAVRRAPPASWHDVSVFERCITRSLPGAMMPGFYNHNYRILQTPGYVVLLVEMIHDVRVIPTDGRPHLGPAIQQWLGNSRGRWEGNTLVVETTNVIPARERRPSHAVYGGSEQLKLVERFTRVDTDTIDYQFTVTDPVMFTKPWTVSAPMTKIDIPIYEYACHEGNYSILNMLRGARQQELEK